MTDKNKSQLALLNTCIGILEAENALLTSQRDAYEDFIWAVLGMFSEKNMEVFNTWVASVLKAIDKLPNSDKVKEIFGTDALGTNNGTE